MNTNIEKTSYIITNWENDLIDKPEEILFNFVNNKYAKYNFKLLSGLKHRDIGDIYESLKESRVIIMQPNLLDKEQVIEIVNEIAHSIHVGLNGAYRNYEIRDFVFISSNPFEDLNLIKEWCSNLKDRHSENPLSKLLYNCEVHFYGFNNEHYELKSTRYPHYEFHAIRYK